MIMKKKGTKGKDKLPQSQNFKTTCGVRNGLLQLSTALYLAQE